MKELLERVSAYHIFNYILPGVVFVFFMNSFCHIRVVPIQNIVADMFLFYFYGLIISRIGSVLIEPLLIWLKIIRFVPYENYAEAALIDPKLSTLSDINNMYRTFISVFFVLLIAYIYCEHLKKYNWLSVSIPYLSLLALISLFILAFRKQTDFVRKRVDYNKSKES